MPSGDSLSDRDRDILEFERQWWKYAGAKEQAIRDLFDMSATRYYQVLNALLDNPAALEADPMLVKRLRRMRASRQRARSARRLGIELSLQPERPFWESAMTTTSDRDGTVPVPDPDEPFPGAAGDRSRSPGYRDPDDTQPVPGCR